MLTLLRLVCHYHEVTDKKRNHRDAWFDQWYATATATRVRPRYVCVTFATLLPNYLPREGKQTSERQVHSSVSLITLVLTKRRYFLFSFFQTHSLRKHTHGFAQSFRSMHAYKLMRCNGYLRAFSENRLTGCLVHVYSTWFIRRKMLQPIVTVNTYPYIV